ncbi:M35 family metallo-endopeptidase [Massilia sp. YIM B02769]|uniref:M35 family metallo-endopeptidase n=1 Tax=Massilia sp. YIM B02769 TaxID=3050129 RepID=UPI0025B71AA1|nr:M35 family metallo-endopeptidase [Massilia sp. YIM B02769]MDN4057363.1 M35 family metallo-endopeptidase [Massilia sp. YIM B02769]
MRHPALFSALPAACALLLAALPAHANPNIAVTVTPEQNAIGKGDDVNVTVTLTNTGSTPQRLLKWRTPFVPPEHALFHITRDGQPVRYLGRHVKRAAPLDADYIVLAPGEARSARVELSSLYEMGITGAYSVRYLTSHAAPSAKLGAGTQLVVGDLASNPAAIWIEGRLPRGAALPQLSATPAAGAGLTFSSCSNAQQTSIANAFAAGTAMAADGLDYLTSRKQQGQRYVNWFGPHEATRVATVTSNFTAIKDAFETRPVKVDCGCNEPYFAYVYPAQPYNIYVCRAFWTAPLTGTDSMGGTLLHEMSHFNVVAGTDDHVYGQSGAADLARTSPERAINNADSHEYFGENNPTLP